MNEIKQIHLGRSAFTIALDAHAALRTYLDAIRKLAGKEVLEEVELRMAELLSERGIDDQKVILEDDIAYLRSQLGEPKDFSSDEAELVADEASDNETRRLYRDPQTAVLGGVASGLAAYLDMPVWVVRLLFVILTFLWGSSVVVYLLLWLLIPEARTPSDRLRMQGKPVNVDTLRAFVESAPIRENAKEMGDKALAAAAISRPVIARTIRFGAVIASVVIGLLLLVMGITGALYTIGVGSYALTNPTKLFDVGRLFPVGRAETAVLIIGLSMLLLVMVLLTVVGASLIRRRWALPTWLTASLVALLLVAGAVGVPAGLAVAPRVVDRYNALKTSYTVAVPAFTTVNFNNQFTDVFDLEYVPAPTSSVTFELHGSFDKSKLTANVANGTLNITTAGYRGNHTCDNLCIKTERLRIIVRSPEQPTNFYGPTPDMPVMPRAIKPIDSL